MPPFQVSQTSRSQSNGNFYVWLGLWPAPLLSFYRYLGRCTFVISHLALRGALSRTSPYLLLISGFIQYQTKYGWTWCQKAIFIMQCFLIWKSHSSKTVHQQEYHVSVKWSRLLSWFHPKEDISSVFNEALKSYNHKCKTSLWDLCCCICISGTYLMCLCGSNPWTWVFVDPNKTIIAFDISIFILYKRKQANLMSSAEGIIALGSKEPANKLQSLAQLSQVMAIYNVSSPREFWDVQHLAFRHCA